MSDDESLAESFVDGVSAGESASVQWRRLGETLIASVFLLVAGILSAGIDAAARWYARLGSALVDGLLWFPETAFRTYSAFIELSFEIGLDSLTGDSVLAGALSFVVGVALVAAWAIGWNTVSAYLDGFLFGGRNQ